MWMNTYSPEEYTTVFDVADGDHRVKIVKTENAKSKKGLNMHVVTYSVENSNGLPYVDYICEGEFYNKNMTRFFDAFKIQRGNFNLASWNNHVAYAHFEHRESKYTDKNGTEKTSNKATLVYFHNNVPEVAPVTNALQGAVQDVKAAAPSAGNNQFIW